MPAEFFLEIGCEEIPAKTIARSLQDLRSRVQKLLETEKLAFDSVEATGSARRFVLRVPALAEKQEPRQERSLGPPAKIAFNNGQPSPHASRRCASDSTGRMAPPRCSRQRIDSTACWDR